MATFSLVIENRLENNGWHICGAAGDLRAHDGNLGLCASQVKTASEALRRHLRVLGLEPGASQAA